MPLPRPNEEFLLLRRLQKCKQLDAQQAEKIGPSMVSYFKSVERRQGKLGKISETWVELVPEDLNEHCSLDSLSRGTLTVLVDSSSHLYEMKQRLLEGLEKALVMACKSAGLRKIVLKAGQWNGAAGRGEDSTQASDAKNPGVEQFKSRPHR